MWTANRSSRAYNISYLKCDLLIISVVNATPFSGQNQL